MSAEQATTAQVKRPKWLMDPENPVRMDASTDKSLTRVQMWVMSTLVVFTTVHLAAGVALTAVMIDPSYASARIGLNVIALVLGVAGMVMGFAIHRHRVLNAWIWLGLIPGLVGFFLVLR